MTIRLCILAGLGLAGLLAPCAAARPAPSWTADIAIEHAELRRTTLEDWSGAALQLGRRSETGRLVWARAEWSQRFGAQDSFLQLGLQDQFAGGVGSLAIGSAFGGDFREDLDVRFAWTRPAWRPDQGPGGLDLDLTARIADYGDGAVTVLAPGLVHYLRDRDAWLSVSSILVRGSEGRWESGLAVRGDVGLDANWRLRGGASFAPEVEAGTVAWTRGVELGARKAIGPDRELGWTLTHVDRSGSYARTGLTLSLRQRF